MWLYIYMTSYNLRQVYVKQNVDDINNYNISVGNIRFVPKKHANTNGPLQSFHPIIYIWALTIIGIIFDVYVLFIETRTHTPQSVYRQFRISSKNRVFSRVYRHAPLTFSKSGFFYSFDYFWRLSIYCRYIRHGRVCTREKNNTL